MFRSFTEPDDLIMLECNKHFASNHLCPMFCSLAKRVSYEKQVPSLRAATVSLCFREEPYLSRTQVSVSWASSREAWPAGRERWFCPSTLLRWDLTWSTAFSSGALSTRTWNCWSGSKGGLQKWSEGWSTSPMRTGWESWACSAWRREGCGETWLQPFST